MEPVQEIVFLGLAVSSLAMQVSLPKEKMARVRQEAKQLHSKVETSVQKVAAFVGMTIAAKQVIRMAPLFHRHLQALINKVVLLVSIIEEVKELPPDNKYFNGSKGRAKMVDARSTELQWCSNIDGPTRLGDRVRCILPGLRSISERSRAEDNWSMVTKRAGDAHQLPTRAVGSNFSVVRPTSCSTVCIQNNI